MKPNRRLAQVNEFLREEIAGILIHGISDPVLSKLTVTEVSTSPDLSYAKVYVMVSSTGKFGPEGSTVEGNLIYAGEVVFKELRSHRLHLRKTPHLQFLIDETIEQAKRIENLLNQVRNDWDDAERNP
jgi:ribosome-binding factor A